MYYYSVGRGANLLLNIAPDRHGLLPEKDLARLIEFGKKIKSMFGKSIAGIEQTMKNEGFEIYVYPYPYYGNGTILVYSGKTVGHKHICRFPTVRTEKVEIVINKSKPNYLLKNISLYYVKA